MSPKYNWNKDTYQNITPNDIYEMLNDDKCSILYKGQIQEICYKFSSSVELQRVFYCVLVDADFYKTIISINLGNLHRYRKIIGNLFKRLYPDQYNNFGLPIDRKDLELIVNSKGPSYSQINLDYFQMAGRYIGGICEKWEYENLDIFPTFDLYYLYILTKYKDIAEERADEINSKLTLEWFTTTQNISLLELEFLK